MLTFRVARKLSTHDPPSFTSGKHLENLVVVKQIDICRTRTSFVPCKFPLWVERKAVNHANTRALVDRINFRSRDPWRARFWIIENRISKLSRLARNFWVANLSRMFSSNRYYKKKKKRKCWSNEHSFNSESRRKYNIKINKIPKKNLVRVFLKVFDIYTIQYLTDIFIKSNNFELCAFVSW